MTARRVRRPEPESADEARADKPKRQRYTETTKALSVSLAALNGVSKAADELGLPHQRVSEWLHAASSADIRTYVQQEGLRVAADVMAELPEAMSLLVTRIKRVLQDDEVKWNGTQAQAAVMTMAILVDKVAALAGTSSGGRFGTHSSSGAGMLTAGDDDDLSSQAIARAQHSSTREP